MAAGFVLLLILSLGSVMIQAENKAKTAGKCRYYYE